MAIHTYNKSMTLDEAIRAKTGVSKEINFDKKAYKEVVNKLHHETPEDEIKRFTNEALLLSLQDIFKLDQTKYKQNRGEDSPKNSFHKRSHHSRKNSKSKTKKIKIRYE